MSLNLRVLLLYKLSRWPWNSLFLTSFDIYTLKIRSEVFVVSKTRCLSVSFFLMSPRPCQTTELKNNWALKIHLKKLNLIVWIQDNRFWKARVSFETICIRDEQSRTKRKPSCNRKLWGFFRFGANTMQPFHLSLELLSGLWKNTLCAEITHEIVIFQHFVFYGRGRKRE